MKIILSGCTGFIGGEVLRQCVQSPEITSIIVLSRRKTKDLEVIGNSKTKVIIVNDFLLYSQDVIREMEGAEASIWALGDIAFFDEAYSTKVNHGFTLAAAKVFATQLAPRLPQGKVFRFVKVSGHLTERDQGKMLWLLPRLRKMGGRVETDLVQLQEQHDNFEISVARPNAVLNKKQGVSDYLKACIMTSISVDELAAALIDVAVHGIGQQFIENEELVDKGKNLLKKS